MRRPYGQSLDRLWSYPVPKARFRDSTSSCKQGKPMETGSQWKPTETKGKQGKPTRKAGITSNSRAPFDLIDLDFPWVSLGLSCRRLRFLFLCFVFRKPDAPDVCFRTHSIPGNGHHWKPRANANWKQQVSIWVKHGYPFGNPRKWNQGQPVQFLVLSF